MLVQREMETWRAPLASITPFWVSHFAAPNSVQAGTVEAATGFKKAGDQVRWSHSPQGAPILIHACFGSTFEFRRKKLVGSYLFLRATKRE